MNNEWRAYMVLCRADSTIYTGVTTDIARRMAQHNSGKGAKYTRGRGPVSLAWLSGELDKSGAYREEWRIKRLTRTEKLKMIANFAANK